MKRSKVPFSVKYNRLLDKMHRTAVFGCVVFCSTAFCAIAYQVYYLKYVKHPALKKKEQELLSKLGETI